MVDDTQRKIVDAAGPIFAEKGYRATTVREICTAAGVNLALVNYHFGDKEKLYIEAVRQASQTCMERVPLPTWPPDTSPRQKLADFITMFLNRVVIEHQPAWHSQLIMREMHLPTRACAEFVDAHVRPTAALLFSILGELLPDGVSERQRRLIGFSIVGQVLHYWSARPVITLLVGEDEYRKLDIATLGRHITEFSLAAIDGFAKAAGDSRAARTSSKSHRHRVAAGSKSKSKREVRR